MWWSIIGLGGSCFVTSTDKKTALKSHQVWAGGELRALCQHDSEAVLRCRGLEEVHPGVHALRLEYAPLGDVRSFVRGRGGGAAAPRPEEGVRLRMALDVALGLSHVHERGVQHCDLTCRNLFLFDDYRLKIGDFGGSLIRGRDEFESVIFEESSYELPLRGRDFYGRPARKRELFALGSAIYELMAWAPPYDGLEDDEIETKYAMEAFPPLEGMTAGHIIHMCWDESYESSEDVVDALKETIASRHEVKPVHGAQQVTLT
ncbi:uncharacterized protein E0L32_010699 [Thyridium curvatum]|uniref:EKC/KEOPS complex subunit BUD32 n=1 Tax=Thyridium curvatum TaxID=1093900 RepID=A0A507ATR0_9PEZI|nr:uncharacterized protein E0L32_010699 [Thyridium curvatum]TPX07600.1 hypothetical protein E0L32_010699 [Thyridium curvatum]